MRQILKLGAALKTQDIETTHRATKNPEAESFSLI